MIKENLKNYNNNQMWIRNQIKYTKKQKKTINKLNYTLSDMTNGSSKVYNVETQNVAKLEDCFSELIKGFVIKEEK